MQILTKYFFLALSFFILLFVDFSFFNNKLYFSTFKNEIYIADLNGENKKFITKGSNPIELNNHLFYFDENSKMQYISQN